MKDKLRIELASENRLGRDTFYAELDLPATAEQIKDAKQRVRFKLPCPAAGLAPR